MLISYTLSAKTLCGIGTQEVYYLKTGRVEIGQYSGFNLISLVHLLQQLCGNFAFATKQKDTITWKKQSIWQWSVHVHGYVIMISICLMWLKLLKQNPIMPNSQVFLCIFMIFLGWGSASGCCFFCCVHVLYMSHNLPRHAFSSTSGVVPENKCMSVF